MKQTDKKRILLCNDAHFYHTGYAKYGREVFKRLQDTGKYELAELACYGVIDDPRDTHSPWLYYANHVDEKDRLFRHYKSNPQNEFGKWRFERVCLDFNPTHIAAIRDPWMDSFIGSSPLRPFYNWTWMPTVDSAPQREEWIDIFMGADHIKTYTEYGQKVLEKQGGGHIKLSAPAPPGVDLEVFRPVQNKAGLRQRMGFIPNANVIGTIMRNQSVLFDSRVNTGHGYTRISNLKINDVVLTSEGNLKKIKHIWSYKELKRYTWLTIFGNNIYRANATSEHKFHFENGIKPISEAKIKERIKVPVVPLEEKELILDLKDYITLPKHWKFTKTKIIYNWKGPKREYNRFVEIDEKIMRLFGWYCAEGWCSSSIQFGLHTHEVRQRNEIIGIIKDKFNGHCTISHDKEYQSTTISWGCTPIKLLLMNMFGNGSRNKKIPIEIKRSKFSIHLASAYLEGDGSFYNEGVSSSYVLSGSYSSKLSEDIRDILMSNGIFTTLGNSIDKDSIKTNLGIYKHWAIKLNNYLKHNTLNIENNNPKGNNWKNNVSFCGNHFLVPILKKETTEEIGPYFDLEVEDDFTYNVEGYACNNSRKLYPDLFAAFRMFLDKCYNECNKNLAEKTYLYIHCSYPDKGWEIPELIRDHGIGRKVLMTYICRVCKTPFCSLFRDAKTVCPNCHNISAMLPNTNWGLDEKQLAQIINVFDVYVQYSNCEGCGVPQLEAAACGVPIMSVNYSAMEDVVRDTHGIPIPVHRMFKDIGTGAMRALPDNAAFVNLLYSFLQKPESIRRNQGRKARKGCEKKYNWDRTAKIWEEHFDNVQLEGLQGKWDSPARPVNPIPPFPQTRMTNSNFVNWVYMNVKQEPDEINTRAALSHLRHLNYGAYTSGSEIVPFDQKKLYGLMKNWVENKMDCENARTGKVSLERMPFIYYARQREKFLNE